MKAPDWRVAEKRTIKVLKSLRKKKGLSQEATSKKSDLDLKVLHWLESDEASYLTVGLMHRIAKSLGYSVMISFIEDQEEDSKAVCKGPSDLKVLSQKDGLWELQSPEGFKYLMQEVQDSSYKSPNKEKRMEKDA